MRRPSALPIDAMQELGATLENEKFYAAVRSPRRAGFRVWRAGIGRSLANGRIFENQVVARLAPEMLRSIGADR